MENKTYRAIRHDVVRAKQKQNDNEVHHLAFAVEKVKATEYTGVRNR